MAFWTAARLKRMLFVCRGINPCPQTKMPVRESTGIFHRRTDWRQALFFAPRGARDSLDAPGHTQKTTQTA
jgi:hypothetical protein